MVEAPLALQKNLTIPQNHYDACAAASPSAIPTAGNAAGNTVNLLDLTGEPAPPPRLPDGFTTRGIVALVFSCISGVLGVVVVGWYGLVGEAADPKETGLVGGVDGASEDDGVVPHHQGAGSGSSNNNNAAGGDGRLTMTSGGGAGVSRT